MARLFDDANTQYLRKDSAVYTTVGMSMHAWIRSDSATANQAVLTITDSSVATRFLALQIRGDVAGDPAQFVVQRGAAGAATAATSSGYTANQWHSILGVEVAQTNHAVYIDGGSKGSTATDPGSSTTLNKTNIGRLERSSIGSYFSGDIAEVAVWSGALTDDDAVTLARGVCPLLVRPDLLVEYWSIIGNNSPETGLIGAFDLTLSASAPTKSDHPRISRAVKPYVLKATYVAPPPAGGGQVLAHGKYW